MSYAWKIVRLRLVDMEPTHIEPSGTERPIPVHFDALGMSTRGQTLAILILVTTSACPGSFSHGFLGNPEGPSGEEKREGDESTVWPHRYEEQEQKQDAAGGKIHTHASENEKRERLICLHFKSHMSFFLHLV